MILYDTVQYRNVMKCNALYYSMKLLMDSFSTIVIRHSLFSAIVIFCYSTTHFSFPTNAHQTKSPNPNQNANPNANANGNTNINERRTQESSSAHTISCPLTEFEQKNVCIEGPISTLTWFEFDVDGDTDTDNDNDIDIVSATAMLRSRVSAIVSKNPWLLGSLELRYDGCGNEQFNDHGNDGDLVSDDGDSDDDIRDDDDDDNEEQDDYTSDLYDGSESRARVHLEFNADPHINMESNLNKIFQSNNSSSSSSFHLQMSMEEAVNAAAEEGFLVKQAKELIGTKEPIFKVSLVRDSSASSSSSSSASSASKADKPRGRFALITSLCHRVGDGCTFYKLHGMLNPSNDIIALDPVRKLHVMRGIEAKMGRSMLSQTTGIWIKLKCWTSFVVSKLRRDTWEQKMFVVNPDYVDGEKLAAARLLDAMNRDRDLDLDRDEDDHGNESDRIVAVSTNDILTSACFKLAHADAGYMTVNLRGRVDDCLFTDAPNYFQTIIYRPPDFENPALIRKSITSKIMRRALYPTTKVLPNNIMRLLERGHCTICTNWSGFHKDNFTIGDGVTQLLHMPLKQLSYAAPSLMSQCIIFKPASGVTAILVTGTPAMVRRFEESEMLQKSRDVDKLDACVAPIFANATE